MTHKILLVDDEPDVLRLLQMKLEKEGFEVSKAFNGLEAIDKAQNFKPDAILMDVMMPELDGHSAMIRIKKEVSPPPLVLMLTAKDQPADMQQALLDGADDYITKPYSPRDLISRLHVALIKAGKLNGTSEN